MHLAFRYFSFIKCLCEWHVVQKQILQLFNLRSVSHLRLCHRPTLPNRAGRLTHGHEVIRHLVFRACRAAPSPHHSTSTTIKLFLSLRNYIAGSATSTTLSTSKIPFTDHDYRCHDVADLHSHSMSFSSNCYSRLRPQTHLVKRVGNLI